MPSRSIDQYIYKDIIQPKTKTFSKNRKIRWNKEISARTIKCPLVYHIHIYIKIHLNKCMPSRSIDQYIYIYIKISFNTRQTFSKNRKIRWNKEISARTKKCPLVHHIYILDLPSCLNLFKYSFIHLNKSVHVKRKILN